jgi:hypothetical protein
MPCSVVPEWGKRCCTLHSGQLIGVLESDATAMLRLIERWRNEAVRAGRPISRIALARLTRWTSNMTALELS